MPKSLVPLALMLPVMGCATIFEGTGQSIALESAPPGAACTVDRAGKRIGAVDTTPGSFRVDKSKEDLAVACTKPGYAPGQTLEHPHFVGTTFLNLILGGVPGFIVDAASGANMKYPERISVPLTPLQDAPAAGAPASPTPQT